MNWFERIMGANRGTMPKWHGTIIYFAVSWLYWGIMVVAYPTATFTDAMLCFCLAMSVEQLMNAIYGWKHNMFVHPQTGRNLFFFHLAAIIPFMVLVWMNCPIWAIVLLFLTSTNDGRAYMKPELRVEKYPPTEVELRNQDGLS